MSKRDDIALRVLSKLQQRETATDTVRPRPMNTFIGQVGEQMTQGFAARVEALERERREGDVILSLDPKQIRRAVQANRHELSLSEADEDFIALKQSLKRDKQILPVSVRPIEADPEHSYELVTGRRRHAAALQLDRELPEGFKLRAVLDTAAQDPVVLALHMYLENAARKDLSAYETGAMFRHWLEAGIFGEQQDIVEATGLGKQTVSKYLQVAHLPEAVLNAFGDPRVIAVRWAENLVAALKSDESAVLTVASKIATREERPAPDIVLRQLVDAVTPRKTKRSGTQSETIKIDGRTAFAYSLRNERIAIRFGKHVDREIARELTEEVKELLTRRLKSRLGRGSGR
jgi:ParB family chromosome partitioning protein